MKSMMVGCNIRLVNWLAKMLAKRHDTRRVICSMKESHLHRKMNDTREISRDISSNNDTTLRSRIVARRNIENSR